MRRKFIVSIEVPEHVGLSVIANCIRTGVQCEGGSYEKTHPMFGHHPCTVKSADATETSDMLDALEALYHAAQDLDNHYGGSCTPEIEAALDQAHTILFPEPVVSP